MFLISKNKLSVAETNKAFIDIRVRPGIGVATPPKEDRATTIGDLHTKFRGDRSSGSRDMLADRQTHKQTRVDHNTLHPLPGQSKKLLRISGKETDRRTERQTDNSATIRSNEHIAR